MSKSKKKGKTELGLDENIEGLLSYLLGWITGIVFLVFEKHNKFVKFHSAQSIVVFGFFTLLAILAEILKIIPFIGFFIYSMAISIIILVGIVVWIISMIKAYQHELFEWPIAGKIAFKLASKVN
ncbi:MAG: DUF4870 domain-containing protein [Candidatus Pacearchaeota archaeon]